MRRSTGIGILFSSSRSDATTNFKVVSARQQNLLFRSAAISGTRGVVTVLHLVARGIDVVALFRVVQMLHDPSLRDLGAALRSYPNLIEHAKRIRAEYFPETLPMEADVVKE